jgi:hypothetical protein
MSKTIKTLVNIEVTEVTANEVMGNERREYNQSIWEREVKRYVDLNGRFFLQRQKGKDYDTFHVVYEIDGIRFLGEVSYSSCLSGGAFARGNILDGGKKLHIFDYVEGRYGDNKQNRNYFKQITKIEKDTFFTKSY